MRQVFLHAMGLLTTCRLERLAYLASPKAKHEPNGYASITTSFLWDQAGLGYGSVVCGEGLKGLLEKRPSYFEILLREFIIENMARDLNEEPPQPFAEYNHAGLALSISGDGGRGIRVGVKKK
ncbi:hypothetical protein BDD12DRAFT_937154 [Trichophaea hybrida]|nr:hypothetical protein BDD12DRAFT_937154 [Trichophaea hybrida]